jgi:hypothetical protein
MLLTANAFVAWLGLSIVWSGARVESVAELERALVYLAGLLALLLVVRPRSVSSLLAGLVAAAGLICAYALATRLLPDRVGTFDSISQYRLSEPIGYWNALGVFAAMAALLALGFAARAHQPAGRAAAAGSLPVLTLTLYFTFGRGAWIAFGLGLGLAILLDTRRLQLLVSLFVLAPASVIVVWLASRSDALTTVKAPLAQAAHDGHRLALVLAGAVAASALLGLVLAVWESRLAPGRRLRTAFAVVLVAGAVVVCAGVSAAYGNPPTLARKAYDSFTSPPVSGSRLSARVFSLSSNGRIDLWSVAWRDFKGHPLLGAGAGSFEQYWRVHRPTQQEVRDAHSLYMETLAELGVVGLVLLLLLLGMPLLAVRHRRARLVPFALGAYVAFLLHAGADWDWEVPAVTLAGLCCGAAALIAIREKSGLVKVFPAAVRYGTLAILLVLAAFSLQTLIGNRDASASASAASKHDWRQAAADARSARTWLPWSSEPWRLLGDAQFGQGDFALAAQSYRRAIELDPRNWVLWFDLGYSTDGEVSDAAFAHARALDPLNPEIPRAREAADAST